MICWNQLLAAREIDECNVLFPMYCAFPLLPGTHLSQAIYITFHCSIYFFVRSYPPQIGHKTGRGKSGSVVKKEEPIGNI